MMGEKEIMGMGLSGSKGNWDAGGLLLVEKSTLRVEQEQVEAKVKTNTPIFIYKYNSVAPLPCIMPVASAVLGFTRSPQK